MVTVAVVSFVFQARPEILQGALEARPIGTRPVRSVVLAFLAAAIVTRGVVSWFASKNPDGLEWAISKVTGKEEVKGPTNRLHQALGAIQGATAFLPDYSFKKAVGQTYTGEDRSVEKKGDERSNLGTSVAGIVGVMMTLSLAFLGGLLLKIRSRMLKLP